MTMTLILADVAAKGPVDAWVFWLAAVIAALGIIWRAMRPLRDVGIRNRNIHDAVLGTPAVVDKRTGTVLKDAEPGLVTSLRKLTETMQKSVDANATIAREAAVTAKQAADAAFATERALRIHIQECALTEGTAMWGAIEAVAKAEPIDGPPRQGGSST